MAHLSSTDLTEDKRALRREMGARRAALPESDGAFETFESEAN